MCPGVATSRDRPLPESRRPQAAPGQVRGLAPCTSTAHRRGTVEKASPAPTRSDIAHPEPLFEPIHQAYTRSTVPGPSEPGTRPRVARARGVAWGPFGLGVEESWVEAAGSRHSLGGGKSPGDRVKVGSRPIVVGERRADRLRSCSGGSAGPWPRRVIARRARSWPTRSYPVAAVSRSAISVRTIASICAWLRLRRSTSVAPTPATVPANPGCAALAAPGSEWPGPEPVDGCWGPVPADVESRAQPGPRPGPSLVGPRGPGLRSGDLWVHLGRHCVGWVDGSGVVDCRQGRSQCRHCRTVACLHRCRQRSAQPVAQVVVADLGHWCSSPFTVGSLPLWLTARRAFWRVVGVGRRGRGGRSRSRGGGRRAGSCPGRGRRGRSPGGLAAGRGRRGRGCGR